jgi:AcrR family transcriptional regulator
MKSDRVGDLPDGAKSTPPLAATAVQSSSSSAKADPPRRTGSRAQWKAQTRERVLEAAAQVFAERGYADASVNEIAAAAGVAVGSLYVHFPNKRVLFWTVLKQWLETERRDTEAVTVRNVAAFVAGYDAQLHARSDPKAIALVTEMWLHTIRDESFRVDMTQYLQESRSRISALVHRLREQIPPTATAEPDADSSERNPRTNWALSDEHIATIAMALFRGLAQTRYVDPASVPDDLFSTTMLHLAQLTRAKPTGD